ncbi:DUF2000 domain-containing protein [Nocardiopsis sp. NPDC050513]|uniref:DUF2000 domain-containing protein n=1 Tax=Nocardiopsis sp. NPDC050513 TaxID=3364338 RepID=UPI00379281CE
MYPSVKMIVALQEGLEPAIAANAAAVLGLAMGGRLDGSVADDGVDASGGVHAGLNPHPVPTLVASTEQLRDLHTRASAKEGVTVVGFNEVARRSRTYEEYEAALAATPTEEIDYVGLALFGPRNAITRLTKRLPLMS